MTDTQIQQDDESTQDGEEVVVGRVTQHLCDYCRKDISNSIRIKCCQCTEFILCVHCFADGVELSIDDQNMHVKTHPYRVIDRITASIFDDDWTADDELMLLEGLERYGMGNWQDVSNHIGSKNKTKSRVEQHYNGVYLNSKTAPLPDPEIVMNPSIYPKDPTNYGLVHTEGAPATPDVTVQSVTSKKKLTADASAAGYRPKRRDFDTEYENSAEEVLGDCDLMKYKDEPIKLSLTYRMLEIFNRKLDERSERKKFLIERGLLYVKPHSKHKHNKEFRALYQQAKVFSRFFTNEEEFVEFVEDLQKQRSLVRDVSELCEHRSNGIRTFQEEFVYKEQSLLREANCSTVDSTDTEQRSPSRNGNVALASVNRVENAANLANDLLRRRPVIPEHCIISADGFDISNMDCVELLDMEERAICTLFHILPRHFNILKQKICLVSYATGSVTKDGVIAACEPLEPEASAVIYDLFLDRGLINSDPPPKKIAVSDSASVQSAIGNGRPPLPTVQKIRIKKTPEPVLCGQL